MCFVYLGAFSDLVCQKTSSLDTSLCFFHWFRTNSWTSRALHFPSRWVTCIKRSSRQTTSWREYSNRLRSWNWAFRSFDVFLFQGILISHFSRGGWSRRTRKPFGAEFQETGDEPTEKRSTRGRSQPSTRGALDFKFLRCSSGE